MVNNPYQYAPLCWTWSQIQAQNIKKIAQIEKQNNKGGSRQDKKKGKIKASEEKWPAKSSLETVYKFCTLHESCLSL